MVTHGVPVQIHGTDADPFFTEDDGDFTEDDGDLDAARALVESATRPSSFFTPATRTCLPTLAAR